MKNRNGSFLGRKKRRDRNDRKNTLQNSGKVALASNTRKKRRFRKKERQRQPLQNTLAQTLTHIA